MYQRYLYLIKNNMIISLKLEYLQFTILKKLQFLQLNTFTSI